MKSPGFSILEIIMVMAISSIIMTCILSIYNQTARNMARVERFVFEDTQVMTLKNRLEKDIVGLSAIWFKQAELEQLQAAKEKKEVPKGFKKRSFYFCSFNTANRFDTLTFITTNALQSYGKTVDRFVRIVYQLQVDPKNEGLFRLMRKEIAPATEFIDEQGLKPGLFYELVSGIKSFDITYQLIDRVALNKQMKAAGKAQQSDKTAVPQEKSDDLGLVIRSVKQWNPAESNEKAEEKKATPQEPKAQEPKKDGNASADEDKEEDLGGAPVPKFIEIKIIFGKTFQQSEQEYTLSFSIPSTVDTMPKSILSLRANAKPNPKGDPQP